MRCQHTHIDRCMYTDTFISVRYGRIGKIVLPNRIIINDTIPQSTVNVTALCVTDALNSFLSFFLRVRSPVKQ